VYEHIAVFPRAFVAPPKSLMMFQGEYSINPGPFWQSIHPITMILFVITLILSWKTPRKKNILIALVGYVILLIATFIYFVPEIMALAKTPYEDAVNMELVQRGARWESLSLVRLGILIVLTLVLFIGLTKPCDNTQ